MEDELQKYKDYPEGIVNGSIVSCRYIKLAAQRYLSWFDRDDIEFRPDKVEQVINFIAKLEHYESPFTGQPFLLQPWQKWFISGLSGDSGVKG